jgi:hypothetical protein
VDIATGRDLQGEHSPEERKANDTLKPSGAEVKEASRLYGWRAPCEGRIFAPGEQSRPRLNVGR